MKQKVWNELEELFLEYPILKADPITEQEILDAEKALNVAFDLDYREFLSKYGAAIVGAYPILGLRQADPMGDTEWSVVEVTRHYQHQAWPGSMGGI